MNITPLTAIAAIEKSLREANNYFRRSNDEADDENASYYLEMAFVQMLMLLEQLELKGARQMLASLYEEAKDNFTKSDMYNCEPYMVYWGRLRLHVDSLSGVLGLGETDFTEVRDLKAILRRAVYSICDQLVFSTPPAREADVHLRLEAILRCHYVDLKSKPALSKPIKNFEPDTAIASIKTLIEYKFISNKNEAKAAADQILADAHGYRSPEWRNLLFVIYETHRVLAEHEWTGLLKECGLGRNYDAIVLSGVAKEA